MSASPPRPPARDPDEIITDDPVNRPASATGGWGPAPGSGVPPQPGMPPNGPGAPYVRAWRWSSSAGRTFPWFAILLVLLGVGLLIELLVPELSFGSLIILAAGSAFALAAVVGRIVGATVPALVLIAWATSRMANELEILSGDGWSTLFVGAALLIGWGLARFQRARREWALWLGLILTVIGLADVSDTLPFSLDFAIVVPLAIIGLGVYLIFRNRASISVGAQRPR
jgi:hypothetical protein